VAERLKGAVRASDVVARVGGDEFAVLLQGASADAAAAYALKLGQVLSEPYEVAGHSLRIAASIGSATCPHSGANAHELMKRADEAMYRVKSARRTT
jgi:diguanylate cyclase (GGDEF)-like protein